MTWAMAGLRLIANLLDAVAPISRPAKSDGARQGPYMHRAAPPLRDFPTQFQGPVLRVLATEVIVVAGQIRYRWTQLDE
jgi:hypothetical protein